jgi:hypothetical protein
LVSGTLEGALNDKASRVVATGTPVTIRYEGRITARPGASAWTASALRVLRYDAMTNVYVVDRNAETATFSKIEDAAVAFGSYSLTFRGVDPDQSLDFQLEAFISYPSERGDTSQALWGYVTPYVRVRDFHLLARRAR